MKKEKPAAPKENRKSDHFTPTEVGTLIERFSNEIKVIAEGHSGLNTRLEKLENAVNENTDAIEKVSVGLHGNNRRLDSFELDFMVIRGKIPAFEDGLLKLSKDLKETRKTLETKIDTVETNLTNEIRGFGDRLAVVESKR